MTKINGIDYSVWINKQAAQIASSVDKDGVKGLQGKEIFDFTKAAKDNKIDKTEVYELLGLNVSKTRAGSTKAREHSPEFDKAVEFYNSSMNSSQRYSVTRQAEMNITEILGDMERDINAAYQDCAAFNDPDMMVVRMSPYRYYMYPRFYDRLLNFDIDEIRTRTTKDMDSLNEIRDKIEYIMEKANGETTHTTPQKTEYDVDAIAQKHLGMSYEEFAQKYPKELENCKYVTYASLYNMDATQADVYSRAKSYAAEMMDITLSEAHNLHWDIQERKLYESLDASSDIYLISDFEFEGITPEGLAEFKSGISLNGFEQALIDKYNELKPEEEPDNPDEPDIPDEPDEPDAITSAESESKPQKPVKRVVNGAVLIFNPDGTVYNLNGQRIK